MIRNLLPNKICGFPTFYYNVCFGFGCTLFHLSSLPKWFKWGSEGNGLDGWKSVAWVTFIMLLFIWVIFYYFSLKNNDIYIGKIFHFLRWSWPFCWKLVNRSQSLENWSVSVINCEKTRTVLRNKYSGIF